MKRFLNVDWQKYRRLVPVMIILGVLYIVGAYGFFTSTASDRFIADLLALTLLVPAALYLLAALVLMALVPLNESRLEAGVPTKSDLALVALLATALTGFGGYLALSNGRWLYQQDGRLDLTSFIPFFLVWVMILLLFSIDQDRVSSLKRGVWIFPSGLLGFFAGVILAMYWADRYEETLRYLILAVAVPLIGALVIMKKDIFRNGTRPNGED